MGIRLARAAAAATGSQRDRQTRKNRADMLLFSLFVGTACYLPSGHGSPNPARSRGLFDRRYPVHDERLAPRDERRADTPLVALSLATRGVSQCAWRACLGSHRTAAPAATRNATAISSAWSAAPTNAAAPWLLPSAPNSTVPTTAIPSDM